LTSIADQLRDIEANLDVIRLQRYDDQNEIIGYINDIQYSQGEILENLASVRHSHCRNSEWLDEVEAQLAHIDYHVHEGHGPPVAPGGTQGPNPPL